MIELLRGKVFRAGKELRVSPRRLALIVALARRREGFLRARLLDELWPELDGDAALNAFNVCLFHVRRLFGEESVVQESGCYRLGDGVRVDLWEIEATITALRRKMELDDVEYAELLALSARLQFSRPSVYGDWMWFEETVHRISTLFSDVGTMLARETLRRGHAREAVEFARGLLERDPCDETALEIKVRAYLALGDEAAAFRAYRRYREILVRELGVEPSFSLQGVLSGRYADDDGVVDDAVMTPMS